MTDHQITVGQQILHGGHSKVTGRVPAEPPFSGWGSNPRPGCPRVPRLQKPLVGRRTEKGLRTSQTECSRGFRDLPSSEVSITLLARHQSNLTWKSTTLPARPTGSSSPHCLQNGGYERDSDIATSESGCMCGPGLTSLHCLLFSLSLPLQVSHCLRT